MHIRDINSRDLNWYTHATKKSGYFGTYIQIYPTNNQVKLEERELYERQMSKEAIRYQNDWKGKVKKDQNLG